MNPFEDFAFINQQIDDDINFQENDTSIIDEKAREQNPICELKNLSFKSLPISMATNKYIQILDISYSDVYSLDNLPPNLTILKSIDNNISAVSDLPNSLEVLKLKNNSIRNIDLKKYSNLKIVDISNNPLKTYEFPQSLVALTISSLNLNINSFNYFDKLQYLNICDSLILGDFILPQSIIHFVVTNCDISNITFVIPPNIKKLELINCNLNKLNFRLTEHLEFLDLSNNKLTEIPILPDTLINMNISNNKLIQIPNIPRNMKILNIKNNPQLTLNEIKIYMIKHHNINLMCDNSISKSIGTKEDSDDDMEQFKRLNMFRTHHLRINSERAKFQDFIERQRMNIMKNNDSFRPSSDNKINIRKKITV